MSSSDIQDDTMTLSEDRSKNWANNVIEKSSGGRSKEEDDPKLNWLLIVGVFIVITIVIIYFSYSKSEDSLKENDTPIIDVINNPSLMDSVIPAIDTADSS